MTGVEISKRILLVNFASSALRKVVTLTVLVWMHKHLIEHVETNEYQLYTLLIGLMLIFPLLTTVSVSGLRRYVIEAYAQGNPTRVTQLVSTMAPPILAVGLSVLGLGWLLAWNIDSVLKIAPEFIDDARLMFGLLISGAALRVSLAPFGLGIDVRQKFLWRNTIGLGIEFVRVGLLFALLFGIDTRVLWVVVAMVSANVLEMLIVTAASMRLVPSVRFRLSEFQRDLVRPLMTFGGWSVLNQVAFLLREVTNPVILNRLHPGVGASAEVSAFGFGTLADTQIRRAYVESYSNALPAVTAMQATNQADRLRRTYFRLSRYALWMLALAAVPLIVYREAFFSLYIDNYADIPAAGAVMGLLLARMLLVFPNSILGMVAVAKEQMKPLALRAITMSVTTLLLTLYMVGVAGMGATGSALSTLIVTAIGAPLLMWPFGLRLVEAKWSTWVRVSVIPGAIPVISATPVWIGLNNFMPPTSWAELAGHFAIGGLVYVAALFSVMNQSDRADVAAMKNKFLSVLGR